MKYNMSKLYKVAIIGRVNVGKSTLFNRLIEDRKAITSMVAGTTRDRNYATCTWKNLDFQLIDTGGLEEKEKGMDKEIKNQALLAIKEADLVLFIVDTKTGLMPFDNELALMIKKSKKPSILIANKTDNNKLRQTINEFYKLGLDKPWPVSSTTGIGTGDMLDEIVNKLLKIKKVKRRHVALPEEKIIKVAVVGRPNVGKSSLINAFLGEKRLIVSEKAHTTRDSQDIELTFEKQKIVLVDTAGMRRQSKKAVDAFEKQSVAQSLKTIEKADIVVLVTDVSKKLTWQDKHILDKTMETGAGIMILANKWDLIEDKTTDTVQEFTNYYKRFFPFISWSPLIFCSATQKTRLKKILSTITKIYSEKQKEITENALDKLLKKIVKKHKPSRGKGTKHPYIYSLKQLKTNPQVFAIKVNFKADLHDSYLRFIENNLRYKFGFEGVPIKILVHKSQNMQDK